VLMRELPGVYGLIKTGGHTQPLWCCTASSRKSRLEEDIPSPATIFEGDEYWRSRDRFGRELNAQPQILHLSLNPIRETHQKPTSPPPQIAALGTLHLQADRS
jgi:hypothetical protein